MQPSDEAMFESTGKITLAELNRLYPGMAPGDIVLKFAEHKNFDAARAASQHWDKRSIAVAGNLFRQDHRH